MNQRIEYSNEKHFGGEKDRNAKKRKHPESVINNKVSSATETFEEKMSRRKEAVKIAKKKVHQSKQQQLSNKQY